MSAVEQKPGSRRRRPARLSWIVTALLALLGTTTAAYGFWASTTSSNNAATAADTLSPGSRPAVSASGSSLSVSWAAGTTVNGHSATGYTVTRYPTEAGGTGTPATGGCAGTVTTAGCTEQNVPGGIWYYTVTPAIALWTGAESPRSTGASSDSAAPVATVSGVSPAPNTAGWNSASPVTVTITADDGTGGSGVASITYAVDGGAQQTISATVATVPVSGDGTHTVSYFATDKVGNASAVQTQTVRIDTAAPGAPGLSVPAFVNSSNVAAVPVTGTAEAGSTVALAVSDSGAAHSVTVTATASATGTWSASPDLTSFNQGTVTYSATATDAAGNTGPAKTATSTKDTVAPATAQALSVPAYVNSANVSAVPVSGAAEAAGTVAVTANAAGTGPTVMGTASVTGSGTWSLSLNLNSLNEGAITYTVTVTDAAGNTGAASLANNTKDTVAPALSITAPMYANKANVAAVPVSGTTESGLAVNVTVRSGVSQTVTQQVTPSGTSWSTSMDLIALGDGTLIYTASSTDPAGNTGTATAAGTKTKDTVAPTVAGITLANGTGGAKTGTPDARDTLTITFSEAMVPAMFCPNWNGAALSGTATISNGTTPSNDTISFTTGTCATPTIGTILLGADYVGAQAAVFGANGNASTLTWDATAMTLTIRLGNYSNSSGPVNSVSSGTPSYTPAASLTDLAGNAVAATSVTGNTTF